MNAPSKFAFHHNADCRFAPNTKGKRTTANPSPPDSQRVRAPLALVLQGIMRSFGSRNNNRIGFSGVGVSKAYRRATRPIVNDGSPGDAVRYPSGLESLPASVLGVQFCRGLAKLKAWDCRVVTDFDERRRHLRHRPRNAPSLAGGSAMPTTAGSIETRPATSDRGMGAVRALTRRRVRLHFRGSCARMAGLRATSSVGSESGCPIWRRDCRRTAGPRHALAARPGRAPTGAS